MKTVILCGGQGTRIRDVSDNVPKPMIPVGGIPILWHIMKYYAAWGHKEFILCLGYRGQVIKDFFINYESQTRDFTIQLGVAKAIEYHNQHQETDWRVTLADTGLNAMTGSRVHAIRKYIGGDKEFMLTYGDAVANVDIDRLIAFHRNHGKIMTVTGVRPPGRFGELIADEKYRVTEFNEKPQTAGGLISGGFFICRQEIFDYLDDRESLVFEQEPMGNLVRDQQLQVFNHDGFWQPMDTYRDYMLLNSRYEKGDAPWKLWP